MKNGFRQSMAWLHTWLFVELCKTPAPDGKMTFPNSTTSQPWTSNHITLCFSA